MNSSATATSVLGGFILPQCFAILLCGIMIAQSYVYMLNCKGDGYLLKSIVTAVVLLEMFHTALIIHLIYNYTIKDFGNLDADDLIVWSNSLSVAVEMLIVGFAQGFYVYRIWILSRRSIFLVSVVSSLLFARVTFGLATTALLSKYGSYSAFRAQFASRVTFTCGLSLSVAVDVTIATLLVYFLIRERPGFKATDNVVRTLVVYFVNTGVLTMLVSVIILILFFVVQGSLLFAGMVLLVSKLYSNSLLGTLNARQMLREKIHSDRNISEMSTFRVSPRTTNQQHHIDSFGFRNTQKTNDTFDTSAILSLPAPHDADRSPKLEQDDKVNSDA